MNRRTKHHLYNVEAVKKAIELMGGASTLSRSLAVAYQTVLNWRNGYASPSPLNCVKIEKAVNGGVKREEILPDYPWDEMS